MALVKIARNLILAAGLLVPAATFADDIDLFKGGTDITGQKPNVLIIIDNTVNWNMAANHWPGGKQAQEELEAIATVVGSLTSGDVRIGLMMLDDGSKGYVRYALRDMNATNRSGFQDMATGISLNTQDNSVPTSRGDYGALMHEAFKYFSSATNANIASVLRDYAGNGSVNVAPYTAGNLAGNALASSVSTTYIGPLSAETPCNKNFIIFIGNGFPSTDSANPASLGVTGWTSADSLQIYEEGTKTTYLDEWARFLHKTGSANRPCEDSICAENKVTTYTIDVFKDHIDPPQTALLKSTATVGGGKYFATTSKQQIQDALTTILAEVQAVNSVFTSASLPVSVNTQGTYLNQIYMGVFRPDPAGAPRWMGNLKQYKFGLTTDATGADLLFLADAEGKPAVNTDTGFVTPTARSYWSTPTPSDPVPAAGTGFWKFNPSGAGGEFDAPDGDLVEKGGAAQKLRALGPTTRTVYTCWPGCATGDTPPLFNTDNQDLKNRLAGTSSPVASLTRSGTTVSVITNNDLSLAAPTDTVTISGASVSAYNQPWTVTVDAVNPRLFTFPIAETPVTPATGASMTVSTPGGISQSVAANAVTWNNGVVTVNLPAHGFVNGQSVIIAGADVSAGMSTATTKCAGWPATTTCEYNGTYNIVYVDANNFRYTPLGVNLGSNQTASGVAYDPPDIITLPGSPVATATVNCINNTGTTTAVDITAITRVAGGPGTRQVKVQLASLPTKCASTLTIAGSGNNGRGSTAANAGITLANTGNAVLDGAKTVTGVGNACGATAASSSDRYVCFDVSVTSTTLYSTATIIPASPATGSITATGTPTRRVTSITRTDGNASNVATVTVTTETAHGFGAATSVIIAGADQPEYNGTKTVAANGLAIASGSNTLTFNLTTGPAAPATGATASRGSSIEAATLINWIRGVDNKEDENVDTSLTDVRASVHGDVLHSRPLVINYGDGVGIYSFYGANDGTFRATKVGQDETAGSADGKEAWSFVAPEHYSTLGRLYNNSPKIKFQGQSAPRTPRDYFFDGNIGVYQSADLVTTHIFISMRRGGRFIYAFNVSSPTAPKFLWKKSYTDANYSELGYTWSEPKVVTLMKTNGTACRPSDPSTYVRALVFGAGYDPASEDTSSGTARPAATMGRGVFVVNAADGTVIRLLTPPANDYAGFSNSTRRYPIASDVTLLDTDGDGCIDRIYVGDTGAKMHRFDIGNADPNNWKAYSIAALGDSGNNGGSNDRKFLFPPEVVLTVIDNNQVAYVMDGTGDREQPASTAIEDRFYMIKDTLAIGTAVATSTATTQAVKESQLTEITNFNASTTTIDATASTFKGWFMDYETGEKSVNAPLTVAGTTFFGTNKPKPADPRLCEPNLGIARGYALNFLTGTAALGDRDKNGNINKSDLYTTFKGGGLPPTAVSGVVQISPSKTVRFIIGGGGTGTEGSVIEGTKLQVNPSGTRARVFWYFKKDE